MEFAIGGLAAAFAGFLTNPIQVSKVHLKVSAELAAKKHGKPYKNIFQAGCAVARREGVSALQKGLTSSLYMHLIKYGVKLGGVPTKRIFGTMLVLFFYFRNVSHGSFKWVYEG